ncbi:MAG: deoxyribonuclease IV [Deltaproteobacteria bacterium]|nr:deoxyribonuclease IV [Deltaproteobacteria bacterium]
MTEKQKIKQLLGAHFSIAGGIWKAVYAAASYGCNALQIFTKNASTWKEKTISDKESSTFLKAMRKTGVAYAATHASYLINLAGPDRKKSAKSVTALENELIRCDAIGIADLVLHPGSHMGDGEKAGIARIASNINQVFARMPKIKARILLETTAGQGTSLGHTFPQITAIIDMIEDKDRIGVCLDTCHVFAAGYDMRTEAACEKTMEKFDSIIGLSRLHLIHLNDSKKGCGSHVDRHEHIGEGEIGIEGFRYLMTNPGLSSIPKILETPKKKEDEDGDTVNLAIIRSLADA